MEATPYIAGSWQLAHSSLELLWTEEMDPSIDFLSGLERCPSSPRLKLKNLYTLLVVESSGFDGDWIPPVDMQVLLDRVLSAMRDLFAPDGLRLLELLIQKGVIIGEIDLAKAVQRSGCEVLQFLESRMADFSAKASRALAQAASLNNFEAVRLLLGNGANPRAFLYFKKAKYGFPEEVIMADDDCFSMQAVAAGLVSHSSIHGGVMNLDMCKLLAREGAQLVVSRQDSTPFSFAMGLLTRLGPSPETFSKLEYLFDELAKWNAWESPPALLLELSINEMHPSTNRSEYDRSLEMFEFPLNRGADVSPGSPLAVLSRYNDNVSKDLIGRLLNMGADLDAYCNVRPIETPLQAAAARGHEDLVNLFLESGAKVNSPASDCGYTALLGICDWDPATEEEHSRKMRIYHLLISGGADVNPPTGMVSYTPLHAAAVRGDPELAVDLLSRGARVNEESLLPDCDDLFGTALDFAAMYGRLDMVKLLLNANALSADLGSSGYDGTLAFCEVDRPAIAELIYEHIIGNLGDDDMEQITVDPSDAGLEEMTEDVGDADR